MRQLLLALATLAAAGMAQAQQSIEKITIPCSGASASAVVGVPQAISRWTAVRCTEFGHIVMAAPGWVWHAPRSNEFVRFWSQEDDQNLRKVGHAAHFVQIEARRLTDDQAREANARLAESLGAPPQPLSEAFELQLKTDTGKTKLAYFVISEANARIGNLWGYTCGQTCAERTIFMIWKPQ